VLSQQLSGAAMVRRCILFSSAVVSLHQPAASMVSSVRRCAVLVAVDVVVGRSGAQVRRASSGRN